MLLQRSISDSPSSPSNECRVIMKCGGEDLVAINGGSSATRTKTLHIGEEMENVSPPSVWSESTAGSTLIDSELISTYKYLRFYRHDPTHVIGRITSGRYNCEQMKELWWFHVAQRMKTTLKHVQEDYLREFGSISDASSTTGNRSVLKETTAKSESSHGSKAKLKKGSIATTTTGTSFQPSVTPKNTWSEPSASTMQVRGKTYSKDGLKVVSETSIFSVLGVDSFVSGDKSEDSNVSAGTKSYLRRWKGVCDEMGLTHPPFL